MSTCTSRTRKLAQREANLGICKDPRTTVCRDDTPERQTVYTRYDWFVPAEEILVETVDGTELPEYPAPDADQGFFAKLFGS